MIHGGLRRTYAELYGRARRLASALAARGIGRGDTVAVLLANTPEMVECHYGVPMTGAVLNTLNTRLDAAAIRFCLEHGEAKILITDREFSRIAGPALEGMAAAPSSSTWTIPNTTARARPWANSATRRSSPPGTRRRNGPSRGRVGRDLPELHVRDHGRPEGRGLPPSRRGPCWRSATW